MTDMLSVSEHLRWDETNNELVDFRSVPPARYSAASFEAKVAVYEDRVRTWFLEVAQTMVANGQAREDYVALSIGLAYIEGVEQYRQGKSTPIRLANNWFKTSAKRIFAAVPEEVIERLWKEVRCGLFHSGFTDGRTYLSHDFSPAIAIIQDKLEINPARFITAVASDFSLYLEHLRDPDNEDMRQRFIKLWDHRWENS